MTTEVNIEMRDKCKWPRKRKMSGDEKGRDVERWMKALPRSGVSEEEMEDEGMNKGGRRNEESQENIKEEGNIETTRDTAKGAQMKTKEDYNRKRTTRNKKEENRKTEGKRTGEEKRREKRKRDKREENRKRAATREALGNKKEEDTKTEEEKKTER